MCYNLNLRVSTTRFGSALRHAITNSLIELTFHECSDHSRVQSHTMNTSSSSMCIKDPLYDRSFEIQTNVKFSYDFVCELYCVSQSLSR